MRRNGLQKPYNLMQITTWIILPTLVIQFLFFVTPILPVGASVPLTILFLLIALASAYYAYVCCMTDPIDDRLEKHLKEEEEERQREGENTITNGSISEEGLGKRGKTSASTRGFGIERLMGGILAFFLQWLPPNSRSTSSPSPATGEGGGGFTHTAKTSDDDNNDDDDDDDDDDEDEANTKYCWVCQTRVNVQSMHCKYCDKCVGNFDHHCQWLNTCIGASNYPYFYATVVATFLLVLIHGCCTLSLVIAYFVHFRSDDNESVTVQRSDEWFNASAGNVIAGFNSVFLLFDIVALTLVGQLLYFHMKLRKEGITTYEYIVRDNARRRDRTRESLALNSRRIVATTKAKQEGRTMELWALTVGGWPGCACCDPLRRKEKKEEAAAAEAGGQHFDGASSMGTPATPREAGRGTGGGGGLNGVAAANTIYEEGSDGDFEMAVMRNASADIGEEGTFVNGKDYMPGQLKEGAGGRDEEVNHSTNFSDSDDEDDASATPSENSLALKVSTAAGYPVPLRTKSMSRSRDGFETGYGGDGDRQESSPNEFLPLEQLGKKNRSEKAPTGGSSWSADVENSSDAIVDSISREGHDSTTPIISDTSIETTIDF